MDSLKSDENSGAVEPSVINKTSSAKKPNLFEGSDIVINPELDKYAGDEFVPEKYKEAEIRLTNSILPPFK